MRKPSMFDILIKKRRTSAGRYTVRFSYFPGGPESFGALARSLYGLPLPLTTQRYEYPINHSLYLMWGRSRPSVPLTRPDSGRVRVVLPSTVCLSKLLVQRVATFGVERVFSQRLQFGPSVLWRSRVGRTRRVHSHRKRSASMSEPSSH